MQNKVFDFNLNVDWKLINLISVIDRFDSQWTAIERREGQSLKQLKSIATVRSVGASNRIEGNRMTNEEVDVLLKNIDITKLTDRDSQEVVGYFDVLDLISESYENIAITENNIKSLHNSLMKYSTKDEWHKGDYKKHSNAVEATFVDGTRQIIFQTTEAGFATEDAIRQVIDWYNSGIETQLSPREKAILTIIQNYSGVKSSEIAEKLAIPNPTVKRILSDLQSKGMIEKQGSSRSTVYLAKGK